MTKLDRLIISLEKSVQKQKFFGRFLPDLENDREIKTAKEFFEAFTQSKRKGVIVKNKVRYNVYLIPVEKDEKLREVLFR